MTNADETWPGGVTMTMDVTYTQANAAGGAVVCEISPGAGNEFEVLYGFAKNSGTNGVQVLHEPAVGSAGTWPQAWTGVASGAGTNALFPAALPAAGTSNSAGWPQPPVIISGSQGLVIRQSAAGAQSDTFHVLVNIRSRLPFPPTVTHANSTNPADVSVTAGTEAFGPV